MKKFILIIFLFFPIASFTKEYQNFYNVKYIDNYDGDTITVELKVFKKGKTEFMVRDDVRLKNINAEEIKNRNIEKKKIAVKQKEELRNRLRNAKQIDLLNCERERYGRMLCEVWVDGVIFYH